MVVIDAVLDLEGHFDESGTDGNSRVVVVGGYVGTAEDWRTLEKAWRIVLKEEGAEYYHATDAENARKPRGIYEKWGRKKAHRLTDRVAAIAGDSLIQGVGIYLTTDAWKSATDFLLQYFPENPYLLPYTLLAKMCIEITVESLVDDLPAQESVSFIFEENKFSKGVLDGFQRLKKEHRKKHRLKSITFESKECFPGLQAADLFAWHYRKLKEMQLGYRGHRLHRNITQLVKRDFKFREIPEEALRDWIERALREVFGKYLS